VGDYRKGGVKPPQGKPRRGVDDSFEVNRCLFGSLVSQLMSDSIMHDVAFICFILCDGLIKLCS